MKNILKKYRYLTSCAVLLQLMAGSIIAPATVFAEDAKEEAATEEVQAAKTLDPAEIKLGIEMNEKTDSGTSPIRLVDMNTGQALAGAKAVLYGIEYDTNDEGQLLNHHGEVAYFNKDDYVEEVYYQGQELRTLERLAQAQRLVGGDGDEKTEDTNASTKHLKVSQLNSLYVGASFISGEAQPAAVVTVSVDGDKGNAVTNSAGRWSYSLGAEVTVNSTITVEADGESLTVKVKPYPEEVTTEGEVASTKSTGSTTPTTPPTSYQTAVDEETGEEVLPESGEAASGFTLVVAGLFAAVGLGSIFYRRENH